MFKNSGTYKFEFNGTIIPYSDVNALLEFKLHGEPEIQKQIDHNEEQQIENQINHDKEQQIENQIDNNIQDETQYNKKMDIDLFTKFLNANKNGKISIKNVSTILPINQNQIYYIEATPKNINEKSTDTSNNNQESMILLIFWM